MWDFLGGFADMVLMTEGLELDGGVTIPLESLIGIELAMSGIGEDTVSVLIGVGGSEIDGVEAPKELEKSGVDTGVGIGSVDGINGAESSEGDETGSTGSCGVVVGSDVGVAGGIIFWSFNISSVLSGFELIIGSIIELPVYVIMPTF